MMTMPVIGAPNTLAQQGLGDTDNTPTNAPIPPMPSVSMPSAPPMPASAPPSPMPPQLRPQATQGNGLNEVLKQILPMLVSGIVARKGGAQAGSAVLEGMAFGQEQRRKREDEQLQAQMLLDQQDMKTRQESEQRRFERETKLAAFVSDIAKNTATLDDPAAFAQAIDLAESMAQRVYGAPAGFIKGQIKFNDSKRLEKERKDAQSILDNLQKRYAGDDPNWMDSMIQSGATVGGKSVADLAALVNMDVKTATGDPVEISTPIRTVGSAEDAAKAAVEEARREARRNKKPFTQADATRISQQAVKTFKDSTKTDSDQDPVLAELRDLRLENMRNAKNQLNPGQLASAGRLADNYAADSKDFATITRAYRKVSASAANPSPAGDLSLIFAYMKILDPGSVVREGEFATAQNAAGIPDQIRNLYNKAINGTRLAPAQRTDFVNRAKALYESASLDQQSIMDQYRHQAELAGVPSDLVVIDYGRALGTGGASGPKVGDRRMINGQMGEWDGKGWKAVVK